MRDTLENWIPRILAAQEPDGYLQTAFTLRDPARWAEHWSAQGRGNHEGYVAGYFIESAINHYMMTRRKDNRLYTAARKLADCWSANLGPAPKKEWFDGHQEMEQALVRFGRFVNQMEGDRSGDRYVGSGEVPARQPEGRHGVRPEPPASDAAVRGGRPRGAGYLHLLRHGGHRRRVPRHRLPERSPVNLEQHRQPEVLPDGRSGERRIVGRFGPDYSLRQDAYCESCSSCGEIFFQWKLHLAYGDSRFADLCEETLHNTLLGSLDLAGRTSTTTTPRRACRAIRGTVPMFVGNIPRTLLMLPTWMYTKGPDGVYVNLFVGSTVTVEQVAGTDVELRQPTDYPWDGRVNVSVNPKAPTRFSLRIRVPNRNVSTLYRRTPDADGLVSISVNGAVITPTIERGYAVVTRTWKAGDRVEFVLPMRAQRVHASAKIAATAGRVALADGPSCTTSKPSTKTSGSRSVRRRRWPASGGRICSAASGSLPGGSPTAVRSWPSRTTPATTGDRCSRRRCRRPRRRLPRPRRLRQAPPGSAACAAAGRINRVDPGGRRIGARPAKRLTGLAGDVNVGGKGESAHADVPTSVPAHHHRRCRHAMPGAAVPF